MLTVCATVNRLPKLLGKSFYKTTVKRPIPVDLARNREKGSDGKKIKRPEGKKKKRDPAEEVNARPVSEIVREIKKALSSALVHLSRESSALGPVQILVPKTDFSAATTNTAVRVGYAGWPPEHVADNVMKVSAELVEKLVPQKWNNVRSIYIKGPATTALPIYQTEELWIDESEVVPDDQAPARVLPGEKQKKQKKEDTEKANVGKKRKSIGAETSEPETASSGRLSKKVKKLQAESNDDKLNEQIAERKATLKKQKKAAKAAVEL